ncbi:tRNA-specific adenosine deaminase subunit tad3 [Onygenales sp. PD_12]|nr:tRNA-specific adenosine deaminase subunit tad3 [Onygenales sp. PD_12]
MEAAPNFLQDIKPLRGSVSLLKTVQETRSGKDTVEAYVAEINIKSASKVLKLLDSKFPKDPSLSLVHLRRFAKPEFIPDHLKGENSAPPPPPQAGSKPPPPQSIYILIPPPLPELSVLETLLTPYAPIPPPPSPPATDSSCITTDDTSNPNPDQPQPAPVPPPTIRIQSTRIPLYPPTTEEESTRWSRTLWPTIFNPAAQSLSHSPRGPLLNSVQTSISQRAGSYLALARQVALEAKRSGRGRAIGAVVVDPALAGEEFLGVVAVAGDARYWRGDDQVSREGAMEEDPDEGKGQMGYNPDNEGQLDQHALMRAISLVAYKRLNTSDSPTVTPSVPISRASTPSGPEPGPAQAADGLETITTDADNPIPTPKKLKLSPPTTEPGREPAPAEAEPQTPHPHPHPHPHPPPTPLESHFLSLANLQSRTQGGYLCTGLDIYLTHEPCVCCSMGMLLSRFRAVVVLQPTGREDAALDPEVGYGLHWRRELNWRAVGFRFLLEEGGGDGEGEGEGEGLERGVFHA